MWHVLHAAPHSEVQVCKYLALHGVEAYAPQFPAAPRTRPGSTRDARLRLVFPRYVFLRPPAEFSSWDRIRWAPGVNRLLQQDGSPAIVEDDVIDHLRRRLADRAVAVGRRRWQRGQAVSILHGPLRMLDAIFEAELDAPNRVRVLVQLLGRTLPVEVDASVVSAV